jgi:hypothetical protein
VSSELNAKYAEAEWRMYFQKEEMSLSQQIISNFKVVATKDLMNQDRRYEIWVVVEVPKNTLVENFDQFFSSSKLKNIEESKNKFQQLFKEEWEKILN